MIRCNSLLLLSFIKNRNNEEAKSLIRKGNLFDAVDSRKNSLLHYAAEYGNPEIVQFLIDSGGRVDVRNDLYETPLGNCFVSDSPCKKVIEILLRAGADIYETCCNGEDLSDIVNCVEWLDRDVERYEILKLFLDEKDNALSCFDLLYSKHKEAIKTLLDTNVNLSQGDYDGKTIIHMIATNSNPGVVELLHGRDFDVNIRDDCGQTPLMYAAKEGNARGVKFLLNEGADIEATLENQETVLYNTIEAINDDSSLADEQSIREAVQVLLERGANVQVETNRDNGPTIFDVLSENKDFESARLLLAHLALQEALGTTITDLIRSKINSDNDFKNYFEYCQQKLSIEIHSSITLFDLLTASDRKMECYLHYEGLASKLIDLQVPINYFDTILGKRITKANRMNELRKTAAKIICKLMKLDYECYPFVIDEIASYLDEKDIEYLMLIQNELP